MPNLAPKSNGVLINPVETQQQMILYLESTNWLQLQLKAALTWL